MLNTSRHAAAIPSYSLEQSSTTGCTAFEIIEVRGQARKLKANFLTPHRKDYYLLALVNEGGSRHWVDMVPYTLQPHKFYFSTPWQVHLKEQHKSFQGILLFFTDEFLELEETRSLRSLSILQNPCNGHELEISATDKNYIQDLLTKIQEEFRDSNHYRLAMLQTYLKALLIYTSRLYNEQYKDKTNQPERIILQKFRNLINDHFNQLHEVAAYADILNLSAGHLGDIIKQQSGKPAIEHIHERIIMEAKRLLFHTDKNVKEIAFQLGFEDASYFNRFFKRITSTTPLKFRNTREMYH